MANAHTFPENRCPVCLKTFEHKRSLRSHLRSTRHNAAIGDVGARREQDEINKMKAAARKLRKVRFSYGSGIEIQEV